MARQQQVDIKAAGLWTQPSRLDIPDGALLIAKNIDIERESVISKRRGHNRYNDVAFGAVPTMACEYRGSILALDGATLKVDNGTGTFSSWAGSYTKPADAVTVHKAESNRNLYWTSNAGIYKNYSLTGTPSLAGMPVGLDCAVTQINPAAGWMDDKTQVAYKIVWIRADTNNNEVVGAPSPRVVMINNTGNTVDIRLRTTIPGGILAGDFCEIYRTFVTAGVDIDPGDDCFLLQRLTMGPLSLNVTSITRIAATATVTITNHGLLTGDYVKIAGANEAEYNGTYQITKTGANTFTYSVTGVPATPATGTITAAPKTMSFEDIYDEIFLEQSIELYTNTTQEGLTAGNYRPPLSCSIENWKGYMWYGNTQREQAEVITMIAVPSNTATFVITGSAIHSYTGYTAGGSEDVNTQSFQIGSTAVVSADITSTADSLVKVINLDPTNTEILAWRDTSADAAPGVIWIMSRATNAVTLTFTSNDGTKYSPVLPVAGTTIASTNDDFQNRLYYSKYLKPEAVTLLGYFEIGSPDHAIEAVVALRDSLIILKTDGIWRLSGESEWSFALQEIDLTAFILAPESARRLGDRVYAVTNKGAVKINEYGVEIVSHPIEPDLRRISTYTNFRTICHATAYEGLNDNKYIVWVQTDSTDTYATQAFVYNYLLAKWSNWVKSIGFGYMLSTNRKLYLCHAVDKYILQERKTFSINNEDYMDEDIPIIVTAKGTVDGVTYLDVTYTYTGATLAAGFLFLYTVGNVESKVTAVTALGGTSYRITLADLITTLPAVPFAAEVVLAISSEVVWAPVTAGSVGVSKSFQTIQLYNQLDAAYYNYLGTYSNRDTDVEMVFVPVPIQTTLGWGSMPWGTSPWGSPGSSKSTPLRIFVPRQHRIAEELFVRYTHAVAKETFNILSMAVTFTGGGEGTTRVR